MLSDNAASYFIVVSKHSDTGVAYFALKTLIQFITMINTAGLHDSIFNAVGNTPLVRLKNMVPADCAVVYVKLEYFNLTGSYKDRMALYIIEAAEKRGSLKKGMTVGGYCCLRFGNEIPAGGLFD